MNPLRFGLVCICLFSTAVYALDGDDVRRGQDGNATPFSTTATVELQTTWKMKDVAARLQQPGATGQQDVFWELVHLCEAQQAARTDKNVEALFDWLLFDAHQLSQRMILESASIKLPVLMPKVGRKILIQRLRELRTNQSADSFYLPATWPDFPLLDKPAFAGALKEIADSAPVHNPVTRIWMAACALLAEAPDAEKNFTDARAALEKDIPTQSRNVIAHIIASLEQTGSRAVLKLLIAQAENEKPDPKDNIAFRDFGGPLRHLQQLLGWHLDGRTKVTPAELERTKTWLNANFAALTWDPALRHFVSDAPPPGEEKQYEAAKKVLAAYGYRYIPHARDAVTTMAALGALLKTQPGKDVDAKNAVGELLTAQIHMPDADREFWLDDDQAAVLADVAKTEPEIAATIWAKVFAASFMNLPSGNAIKYTRLCSKDPAFFARVMTALQVSQADVFEKAQKSGDAPAALTAAMIRLFAGAKIDFAQITPLLEKSPEWNGGRSKLVEWNNTLNQCGRTGGLRLMLFRAAREDADENQRRGNQDSLQAFYQMCQWYSWGEKAPGTREQQIAAAVAWLDASDEKLTYDPNKSRFTGVPPPHKAEVFNLLSKLPAALNINPTDALENGSFHRAATLLIGRIEINPEMAANPVVGEVLVALLSRSTPLKDQGVYARALMQVGKYPPDVAAKVVALLIDADLDFARKNNTSPSALKAELNRVDAKVIAGARAILLPAYQAKYGAVDKNDATEAAPLAMTCAMLGGAIPDAEIENLIKKWPTTTALRLGDWADIVAWMGNRAGLRMLLVLTEYDSQRSTMYSTRFERLVGSNQNFGRTAPERIAALKTWYDQNEAQLVFDEATRIYRAPGMAPPGPAVPEAQPRTVRPPRPPTEDKF